MKVLKANKNSSKVILLKNKIKNGKGFTLIELMITVAIVGILAAVALPAYQDYVARSQVSEGLTLVSGAKPVIAEYYSNHGSYPTSSDIGFNGYVGSYVGSTTIGADGAIVATFSDDAHRQLRGQTVTLTPEEVEETGNLKWSCSSSVDSKFLPTSCSNDGSTTNPGGGETDPGETEPPNPGGENPGEGDNGETDPPEPSTPGVPFSGQIKNNENYHVVNGEMLFTNETMLVGMYPTQDLDGTLHFETATAIYTVSPDGNLTITTK